MVSHDYDLTEEPILQMAALPSCSAQVQCTYCRQGRPAFFLISRSPFPSLSQAPTNCKTFMFCVKRMKPQGMHKKVQGIRVSTLFALYEVSAATFTQLRVTSTTIDLPGHLHGANTPWCCKNMRTHRGRSRLFRIEYAVYLDQGWQE